MSKIEKEKRIVTLMISLYCRKKEGNRELCADCRKLIEYSVKRLEHCRFGNGKSSCRKCKVHCYSASMRARIRDVMRFSGPRMLLYEPMEALRHFLFK